MFVTNTNHIVFFSFSVRNHVVIAIIARKPVREGQSHSPNLIPQDKCGELNAKY